MPVAEREDPPDPRRLTVAFGARSLSVIRDVTRLVNLSEPHGRDLSRLMQSA
jgi:hypothetical protein